MQPGADQGNLGRCLQHDAAGQRLRSDEPGHGLEGGERRLHVPADQPIGQIRVVRPNGIRRATGTDTALIQIDQLVTPLGLAR